MIKTATISLEQAQKIWESCHPVMEAGIKKLLLAFFTQDELEGRSELTKTWNELDRIKGFYISRYSEIEGTSDCDTINGNQNIFATSSQAQAALAFAMLSQIAQEANNRVGWVADWSDIIQKKWGILREKKTLFVVGNCTAFLNITFHSKEAAEESLVKHRVLWEDYWELNS